MERTINKRLVWFIYRLPIRLPMDHVVNLETSIREANIEKQHLVAIFFDLEKAYETSWKFCIIKDLHNMGLKGRLSNFIKSFSFG